MGDALREVAAPVHVAERLGEELGFIQIRTGAHGRLRDRPIKTTPFIILGDQSGRWTGVGVGGARRETEGLGRVGRESGRQEGFKETWQEAIDSQPVCETEMTTCSWLGYRL